MGQEGFAGTHASPRQRSGRSWSAARGAGGRPGQGAAVFLGGISGLRRRAGAEPVDLGQPAVAL